MATYIISLLGLVALCVFWAVFQLWMDKHDPDAHKPSAKCGGCDEHCER